MIDDAECNCVLRTPTDASTAFFLRPHSPRACHTSHSLDWLLLDSHGSNFRGIGRRRRRVEGGWKEFGAEKKRGREGEEKRIGGWGWRKLGRVPRLGLASLTITDRGTKGWKGARSRGTERHRETQRDTGTGVAGGGDRWIPGYTEPTRICQSIPIRLHDMYSSLSHASTPSYLLRLRRVMVTSALCLTSTPPPFSFSQPLALSTSQPFNSLLSAQGPAYSTHSRARITPPTEISILAPLPPFLPSTHLALPHLTIPHLTTPHLTEPHAPSPSISSR